MQIDNLLHDEYFPGRVGSVILDHAGRFVTFVAEQLEVLQVTHVCRNRQLLSQVLFHTFNQHVFAGEVATDTPLDDIGVTFDFKENLANKDHTVVRLDFGDRHIEVVETATNQQTFESTLNFLSRDFKLQVFFLD